MSGYNSNSLLPPMPGQVWGNNNSMFNWGSPGGAWGDPNMQGNSGLNMAQMLGNSGVGYSPMGGPGVPGSPTSLMGRMSDYWGQHGDMIGGALTGIGTLGGIWNGIQSRKDQRRQFKFQKNAYNENMDMQKKDLNRKLEANWRDMKASGNTGDYKSLEDYLGKNRF